MGSFCKFLEQNAYHIRVTARFGEGQEGMSRRLMLSLFQH
jgi:hypothetical protein